MKCHPTEFYSLQAQLVAADFTQAAPTMFQIAGDNAFIDFPVPYEILGVDMSSSLTNFGTAIMGVFVIVGQNLPKLTFAKTTDAIAFAITGQNSLTGPPAVPIPSDKTFTKVLLQPFILKANTRIQLYAFGDTTAGNSAAAFVSLTVRQTEKA